MRIPALRSTGRLALAAALALGPAVAGARTLPLLEGGITCINGLGEPLGMPMPGS